MWMFFLLLVACAVLRIFLYKRHKITEAELEVFMDELERDDDDDVPDSIPRNVKMSKKDLKKAEAERKKSYQDFLSDLEAELGGFDEEEDEEDEE